MAIGQNYWPSWYDYLWQYDTISSDNPIRYPIRLSYQRPGYNEFLINEQTCLIIVEYVLICPKNISKENLYYNKNSLWTVVGRIYSAIFKGGIIWNLKVR